MQTAFVIVAISHFFCFLFWFAWLFDNKKLEQDQIFQSIGSPFIDMVFNGYNASMLAYGQTVRHTFYILVDCSHWAFTFEFCIEGHKPNSLLICVYVQNLLTQICTTNTHNLRGRVKRIRWAQATSLVFSTNTLD
jgi:hypothetical protein